MGPISACDKMFYIYSLKLPDRNATPGEMAALARISFPVSCCYFRKITLPGIGKFRTPVEIPLVLTKSVPNTIQYGFQYFNVVKDIEDTLYKSRLSFPIRLHKINFRCVYTYIYLSGDIVAIAQTILNA